MCGIAGVVAWNEQYRVQREIVVRMGEAIAHRGPDGREIWMSDGPGPECGFAFARLAILDLDPRAMQPMTDGRRWLVFNGEIFNFRELRAELEKLSPGYQWKTTGDSEVILRAYDAWGEACVGKLNGMFALAIWEPHTGSIFLARDRMAKSRCISRSEADAAPTAALAVAPAAALRSPASLPRCEPFPGSTGRSTPLP